MKKILSFLFILVFAFALVGCNKDNKKDDDSITVTFNTNGGSSIDSVTVTAENAKTFALPANPTKEGYVFEGWFLDAGFTKAFNSLNLDEKTITLYAKWTEEGSALSANVSFSFDVDVTVTDLKVEEGEEPATPENTKLSGTVTIDALLESAEVEKLEDLKGTLNLVLNAEGLNALVGVDSESLGQVFQNPITLSLYLQNGYAYLVYGLVTYKVNLITLYDALVEEIEAQGENFLPGELELPESLDDVNGFIAELLRMLNEDFHVDFTVIAGFLNALLVFVPEAKTENGKTVYAITQADFEADLDSFGQYLCEHAADLAEQVYNAINTIFAGFSKPREEYEYEGKTFSLSKHGYTDAEGQFHSFEEDLENEYYGDYYAQVGVYYALYLNAYYKVETWEVITYDEYKALLVGTTYTDYLGNTYTYGTPSYQKQDGTVVSLLENIEQLEADSIGYYDEDDNTFYVYATGDEFDLETGKIFDSTAKAIEDAANGIQETTTLVIDAIKQSVKINALSFATADNSSEVRIDVEVDTTPIDEMLDESIQAHVIFSLSAKTARSKATITYPDFSQAIDMTDAILGGSAEGELEN